MRDYVTKVENGGTTSAGQLSAEEFNELAEELENVITRSGQTLNQAVLTQIGQAAFLNGVKAGAFQAGGTVDAIQLTPISGASGVILPADYVPLGGAKLRFFSAGTNTAAVTINIGQTAGTLLGTKDLVDLTGTALTGGEIPGIGELVEIQFDATNDRWVLLSQTESLGFEIIDQGSVGVAVSEVDVTWGSSVYSKVEIELSGFSGDGVTDNSLRFRLSDNDGSSFFAGVSDYEGRTDGSTAGGSSGSQTNAALDSMRVHFSTTIPASGEYNLTGYMLQPGESRTTFVHGRVDVTNATSMLTGDFGYRHKAASVINGLRIFMTNGEANGAALVNIDAGDYLVRGWF